MKSRMKDTLLLIGAEESSRRELRDVFESSYYLLEAQTAEQGTYLMEQNGRCIAAVLVDIPFDQEAVRALVEAGAPNTDGEIPVIFLIPGDGLGYREEQMFLMGAADVVHKPYARISIRRRVQFLVDLYHQRLHLEEQVKEKNKAIRDSYQNILDTLSAIIEYRDVDTGNHALRIRELTRILLQQVAVVCPEYGLDQVKIENMSRAATLHDIGKISIPDAILNKPGPLTPEEYEEMKNHTLVGADLVAKLENAEKIPYLQYAHHICLSHHERWDGRGYPRGIRGDAIPICAQAVGMIDAFDALTNRRSYKPAFSFETAMNMICNGECGSFSPKLLECFKGVYPELSELARKYADRDMDIHKVSEIPAEELVPWEFKLDAMQLSHLKYQSLLHCLNDTVIELDVDNRIFHVVYNPNPDFTMLLSNTTFDELGEQMLACGIHPDGAEDIKQMQQEFSRQLFVMKRPKHTFRCQIFSPPHNAYHPYEVTLLRVNTGSADHRVVLAVFHNMHKEEERAVSASDRNLLEEPALFDLMNSVLRCSTDGSFTILDGAQTLLPLIGYTSREIQEQFGNSLTELVSQEDRKTLYEMMLGSDAPGERKEFQLRLAHKNGGTVWAICRGRVHRTPEDAERIYLTLTDVSVVREEIRRLGRDYGRNATIADQFKNIIIEWDLQTDEFFCSDQWKDRFGYELPNRDFRQIMKKGFHVHPDDLPQLRKKLQLLRDQEGKEFMDLRISDREGRYLWSRLRAVSQAEHGGKPTRIIGVIYDIHDLKDGMLTMQQKMQQDALTKLLNKASVQKMTTAYLENREPDEKAAMLMLDLDNFKEINDTYGHLYGDEVLTQIGSQLRSMFRSRDVIGRVGGDEFMVILKDIPNEEVARERCENLVNNFRQYLHDLMPALNVSVSVGCALAPDHGQTWAELYRCADTALYVAKSKGKCGYSIYSQGIDMPKIQHRSTDIESNEQSVVNDDAFIRYAFHSLYSTKDTKKTIEMLMAHIGTRFNVSRVYVFENNEDNTCCNNTFEWCNVGIHPEKENLQNISYETDVPGWPDQFDENGVMYCPDIQQLPEIYRLVLEPQGIKSMLHCALMQDGVFRGYVGFDDCLTGCLWTQEQIEHLKFFAEILSVFLYKFRLFQKNGF